MNLSVKNLGLETAYLSINETVQAWMKITDGEVSRKVALKSGEAGELNYEFTAPRGDFSWKTIKTVVSDPLGLVETEMLLPASTTIQIWPKIKKFKGFQFRPHSTLHSPGSIPARLGGSGTDFYGVREYHPGDSLRRLDWRLTTRHPGQFFTKEFEQEEIAEIGLILDAGQLAELRNGSASMVETCIDATASLAEMFLHQGHRVSLLVFGDKILSAFPGYGKMQLLRIMGCLSKVKVETKNRNSANLDYLPIRIFPSHALIIVISSLTSSNERSLFLHLCANGYQPLLISPDPINFVYPTQTQDIITQLAIRAAYLERRLRLNDIAHLRIPVVDWRVSQPLFPLVRNALARSRGQREF